jgi:WD40 repeat protein
METVKRSEMRQATEVNRFADTPARVQLALPVAPRRRIPTVLNKVLDAPDVIDDLPARLIDFNSQNVLAVALGQAIYIWDNGNVFQLMDADTLISGLCWTDQGLVISARGEVELWDVEKCQIIQSLPRHEGRCCSMSFRGHRLASGGVDRAINITDVRTNSVTSFIAHHAEIASLAWSSDGVHLASGGLDGRLLVWGDQRRRAFEKGSAIHGLTWMSPHCFAVGESGSDGTLSYISLRQEEVPVIANTCYPISGLAYSDKWGVQVAHFKGCSKWEIWSSDLKKIIAYSGHTNDILNIVTTQDGTMTATIGTDETLQVWELRDGKSKTPVQRLKNHHSFSDCFLLR